MLNSHGLKKKLSTYLLGSLEGTLYKLDSSMYYQMEVPLLPKGSWDIAATLASPVVE